MTSWDSPIRKICSFGRLQDDPVQRPFTFLLVGILSIFHHLERVVIFYLCRFFARVIVSPIFHLFCILAEGKYIDGGMVSNNPTLDLMSEIHFWNSTCDLMKVGIQFSFLEYPQKVDLHYDEFEISRNSFLFFINFLQKPEYKVEVGCVVSIGTGITPISPMDPSLFEMNNLMGTLRGLKNLSLVVLDQVILLLFHMFLSFIFNSFESHRISSFLLLC